jgi:hypothetical protein
MGDLLVSEPIMGHAAILEGADAVNAPGPPDTYVGIAAHLLPDVQFLARASPPSGIGLPMLCAHALECTLKAYLSRSGEDKHVRTSKVRHNLAKLWTVASADGLQVPTTPPSWVGQLSDLHKGPDYYLRYSTKANGIASPAPATMIDDLTELLALVRDQLNSWRAAKDACLS